ncbi:MAG: hypothetical protein ABI220_01150 [Candidatus Saccharimonadales bacterium]
MSEKIPINQDEVAAIAANQAAANGSWEKFAQPGYEASTGQIAVAAVAASVDKLESTKPTTNTSEHFGYDQSESGLLTPQSGTSSSMLRDGTLVTDKRPVTLEKVENDFQTAKQARQVEEQARLEKLRAPLNDAEIAETASRLAASVRADIQTAKSNNKSALRDRSVLLLDGDSRAFSRIYQIATGDTIQRGNDSINKHNKLSAEERLDDLAKQYEGRRIIDTETGQVIPGGYDGTLYYEFARARDLLAKIKANPQVIRENVINATKVINKTLDAGLNGYAKTNYAITYPELLRQPLEAKHPSLA